MKQSKDKEDVEMKENKTKDKETCEQYIRRMTHTKGKVFTPTGWISVQPYTYRNKKMLFVECYTDCIYKAGQPIARFWISPTESVWLAWHLLNQSRIWNKHRRPRNPELPEAKNEGRIL